MLELAVQLGFVVWARIKLAIEIDRTPIPMIQIRQSFRAIQPNDSKIRGIHNEGNLLLLFGAELLLCCCLFSLV